jgi:large subunit ribosomal protein L18
MALSARQKENILRRRRRVRAKITGSGTRPRLSIHKSNRYLSAQLIDDAAGVTLVAAQGKTGQSMREQALFVGEEIAKAALAKGVTDIVYDRGEHHYAGSVKALADSARAAGLNF